MCRHQIILVGCFLLSVCAGESSNLDTLEHARPKRLTQIPHPYPHQLQQKQQVQQQQHQQYAAPQINYRPYNEAPESIKQLLQLQQYREPIVHIPVGPAPQLQPAAPAPLAQPYPQQYAAKLQYGQVPQPPPAPYRPQVQQPQPAAYKPSQQQFQSGYKSIQARPNPRVPIQPPQNNYTPQYKTQYGQQGPNSLYRPALPGPLPGGHAKYPTHPQPFLNQYPKNLPPHLQKIIDAQRSYQG